MKNNGLDHDVFLDRFTAVAEDRLAISRHEWGFKRAVKNALGVEKDSTVHRWFKKTFPSAHYLIRISVVFDVSIAHLLGSHEVSVKEPGRIQIISKEIERFARGSYVRRRRVK